MDEIDFCSPNIKLAKLVNEVADECDPKKICIKSSVELSYHDYSNLYRKLFRAFAKTNGREIDDESLEKMINQSIAEQEARQKAEEEEQERIRSIIRDRINCDPQAGRKLAFSLLEGIDSLEALRLRYQICRKLPDIPALQKIQILKNYIDSIDDADTFSKRSKEEAYRELAEVYLKAYKSEISQQSHNLDELFICYDNMLSLSDNKPRVLYDLIELCKNIGIKENLPTLENKYIDYCISSIISDNYRPQYFNSYFVELLILHNKGDILIESLRKIGEKNYFPDIFYTAFYQTIKMKQFTLAEQVLELLQEVYKNIDPVFSSHSAWVESQRYRMKYYKMGYSFNSLWTSIYFYDQIRVVDSSVKEKVNRIIKKYSLDFSKHREYLTEIELYKYAVPQKTLETKRIWVLACEKELEIIPRIIAFIDAFRKLISKYAITAEQIRNTEELINTDKYKLANCHIFSELAKHYTKGGLYEDAIRVCNSAIACGYINDGTKMGMIGRVEKIKKLKTKNMGSTLC